MSDFDYLMHPGLIMGMAPIPEMTDEDLRQSILGFDSSRRMNSQTDMKLQINLDDEIE